MSTPESKLNDPLGIDAFLSSSSPEPLQPDSSHGLIVPAKWKRAVDQTGGDDFLNETSRVAKRLGAQPHHLLNVMAAESGLNPAISNPGSNATGLIQFMPSTARGLGTTTEALKGMSAVDQLKYVEKYLSPYKGRLNSQADVYGAIYLPKRLGQSVYATKGQPEYDQNRGLDIGGKGYISAADLEHVAKHKGGFGGSADVSSAGENSDDPLGIDAFLGQSQPTPAPTPKLVSPGVSEMADVGRQVAGLPDPAAKAGDDAGKSPVEKIRGITGKYLQLASGEPPAMAGGPSGVPITINDLAWHYGMTADEWKGLSRKQKRKLTADTQTAVAEGQQKREAGEGIPPPTLGYQNQMRAKAGLRPLAFNAPTKVQVGGEYGATLTAPDPEKAVSPYYQPAAGSLDEALTTPQDRIRRRGSEFIAAKQVPTHFHDPDEIKRSIRSQVIDEQQVGSADISEFGKLGSAQSTQSPDAVNAEVDRRYNEQQAAQMERQRLWDSLDDKAKQQFKNDVGNYAQQILTAPSQGVGMAWRDFESQAHRIGAGIMDFISRIPGDSEHEKQIADRLRVQAQAMEDALASVRATDPPNKKQAVAETVSNLIGGLVLNSPALVSNPIAGFAAMSAVQARGHNLSWQDTLKETAKGATLGAVFEGADAAIPEGASVLGTTAKRAGVISGGTFGVEKAFGASTGDALRAAATNAGLYGIFKAPEIVAHLPGETIASENSPEWFREVTAKATHRKPVVVFNETGDRAASVYVDTRTGHQIIREVSPEEAQQLLDRANRPNVIVSDARFEQSVPRQVATPPEEPADAGVQPINRQLTSGAVEPPRDVTESAQPNAPLAPIAPATPPEPETPRAPESSATIEAQMDALVNGRGSRKAVFIPPGTEVPKIPKGFKASETAQGTIIYPSSITRKQLRKMVESGESYKLMGHVNAETPDATIAVVARATVAKGNVKPGDELGATYVVPGNEEAAKAELMAQHAPYKPAIEVGGADTAAGVVSERLNTPAPETIVTAAIRGDNGQVVSGVNHPQILLSQGRKVPKDRSGPEYGFITSAGRFVSRAEAATIAGVPNTIAEGQLYTEDLTAAKKDARVQSQQRAEVPSPATEDQVRVAQNANGTDTHSVVSRFLASEYKDRILADIGSTATPLTNVEVMNEGRRFSDVYFRRPDGSIVTVKDAQYSDVKPTYGNKRDGFVVTRAAPETKVVAASEVAPMPEAKLLSDEKGAPLTVPEGKPVGNIPETHTPAGNIPTKKPTKREQRTMAQNVRQLSNLHRRLMKAARKLPEGTAERQAAEDAEGDAFLNLRKAEKALEAGTSTPEPAAAAAVVETGDTITPVKKTRKQKRLEIKDEAVTTGHKRSVQQVGVAVGEDDVEDAEQPITRPGSNASPNAATAKDSEAAATQTSGARPESLPEKVLHTSDLLPRDDGGKFQESAVKKYDDYLAANPKGPKLRALEKTAKDEYFTALGFERVGTGWGNGPDTLTPEHVNQLWEERNAGTIRSDQEVSGSVTPELEREESQGSGVGDLHQEGSRRKPDKPSQAVNESTGRNAEAETPARGEADTETETLGSRLVEWRRRLSAVKAARDVEGLQAIVDEMSAYRTEHGLSPRLSAALGEYRSLLTAVRKSTSDEALGAAFDEEYESMMGSQAPPVPSEVELAAGFDEELAAMNRASGRPVTRKSKRLAEVRTRPTRKQERRLKSVTPKAAAPADTKLDNLSDALAEFFPASGQGEFALESVKFDEAVYTKVKPLLMSALEMYRGQPPLDALKSLMRELRTEKNWQMDQLGAMRPYVIRVVQDFAKSPKKAENKKEVSHVAPDQKEAVGDSQTGDGGVRAGDVQGTVGVGESPAGLRRPRRGGDADVGRSDVGSDKPSPDLEQRTDVTDSESHNVEPPSRGDSDLSGNRIRYPSDDQHERQLEGKRDYITPEGSLTRQGSWRETARTNLDILELVKRLDAEGRLATPEEQALLVKFTGWGASEIANNLFPGATYGTPGNRSIQPRHARQGWEELAQRAADLFTPEELETALASTQFAHYTSEAIIRGVWDALNQFGFTGGSILEPGMGVGLFASAAPRSVMQKSRYTGIERDKMTAAIAKQVLQRQAVLEADFVKQKLPKNFFDVAIGNPPFAQITILDDPNYKKYRFLLHDYFFAKSIDSVRPGGLLVFVTSHGTMDKGNDTMRKYIGERADLLGAIRLPQTAFKQNAGTEVVTDVLFLRKRLKDQPPAGEQWLGRADVTAATKTHGDKTAPISEYFVAHPEMVLGKHAFTGTMRGADEYTVEPLAGRDIEEQFREAISSLPSAVYQNLGKTEDTIKKVSERDWSPDTKKEGSLYLDKSGQLRRVDNGSGVVLSEVAPVSFAGNRWLTSYVGLRNALKQAQYDQLHDGDWEASLAELNKQYDRFVKKHGPISDYTQSERTFTDDAGIETTRVYRRFKNQKFLRLDVESPLVLALEKITEDGKIEKGAMLQRRTIKPPTEVVIRSLSDALAVSLDKLGTLNLAHVQELIQPVQKMTRGEIIAELGDSIFEEPGGNYQMSDEYLSGYVIDKLELAEAAAKIDPRFERNVKALSKVQPKALEAANIATSLGATWIPQEVYSAFAREELNFPRDAITFDALQNKYTVHGAQGAGTRQRRSASETWGTAARSPNELLDAALNGHSVKIYRELAKGKKELDETASAAANDIIKKMKDAFRSWIWTDAERTQSLTARYNRQFNNIAPRRFTGDHLTLPGLSAVYKLHPHQLRAVWRILQTGDTYLAHAVGAGKTLEMIVSAMEQRRLGLVKKPMFTVPKHMLNQFASEFLEAYPMANILVADEENFAKENRRRFVAQAALNDLDAVIITHSAFGLVRTTQETADVVVNELVSQLTAAIGELDEHDRAEQRTIKELEARIEAITRKFQSKAGSESRDDVINFEDLGVDMLYVDEAHEFRKLDFVTNREKIKGIDTQGSQKALDLLIKSRWLGSQRPGRSMVLASGTPITNTLAELYSIQRYMDPAELERAELSHFDSWSAQFGEVSPEYEMNAAGKYELVERFSKFINIPELMKRVRQFMDVLTMKELSTLIDVPIIKGGAPEVVVVPATESTLKYLKEDLNDRIETSRAWKPSFNEKFNPDPLINIITDGRLSATDMRFVSREAANESGSKLNVTIDAVIERYHRDKDVAYDTTTGEGEHRVTVPDKIKGAAQIVFSYAGFGEMVAKNRGFDAKAWVVQRLVKGGIPANEIAFMGDYKSDASKQNLFKEMRQGTKRVLLGSPMNMGTGLNVQKRLKTSHYIVPPWFPAHVEQPDGRIVRQGNQNPEVEIRRYATKGTYDSTNWQMLARKARSIEQAMMGDDSQRTLEDITESSLYEMASALAAGDARAIQLASLRRDVERLSRLERAHWQEQGTLRSERGRAERDIKGEEEDAAKTAKAIDAVGGFVQGDQFRVTVKGSELEKRSEIGEAIKEEWRKAVNDKKEQVIKSRQPVPVVLDVKAQGKFPLSVRVFESSAGIESNISLDVTKDKSKAISEGGFFSGISLAGIDEVDSVGLATRIFNALNNLHKEFSDSERQIAEYKRTLKQIDAKLGQPFPDEGELYEKTAELSQLQREMAATAEPELPAPDAEAADAADREPQMALDARTPKGWETQDTADEEAAKISVEGNRVLYLGSQPGKLLSTLLRRPNVGGVHFRRADAQTLANILSKMVKDPLAQELSQAVNQALSAGGPSIVITAAGHLPHELFHESMMDLGFDIPGLSQKPYFNKARVKLVMLGYPDNSATLVNEAAAFIAEGRLAEVGLTVDEATDFMKSLFDSVLKQNPEITPDRFKELAYEAQKALKEAVHAQTNAAEVPGDSDHVRSLPQGRGSGPPKALAGETRRQRRLREDDARTGIAGNRDRAGESFARQQAERTDLVDARFVLESSDPWDQLNPNELEERPADTFMAGIKKAVAEEEQSSANLPPIIVEARRSIGPMVDRSIGDFDADTARARTGALAESARALSPEEVSDAIVYKTHLNNAYQKAADALLDAQDKGDQAGEIGARSLLAKLSEDLLTYREMARRTGYEQGLAFRMRAEMMKSDFTLATVMTRALVANQGEALPPHIEKLLGDLTRERDAAVERLKEYDEEAAQRAAEAELRRLAREERDERRRTQRTKTKDVLDQEFVRLSQQFARAASRLSANPFFDPTLYALIGKMARNRVQAGINNVDELVDSIYQEVRDHVEEGSPRELRDAISGYGKSESMTPDEIAQRLSKIKKQLRDLSAVEDGVKQGRSLVDRKAPASSKETTARRRIKTALRDEAIDFTKTLSPEEQQARALNAMKGRIRNRIGTLQSILAGETQPSSREAAAIGERDSLQSAVDAMNDDTRGAGDRIADATKRVQKSRDRAKSPSQRKALNSVAADLEEAARPERDPEAAALKALKTRLTNRRAQLQRKLDTRDFSKRPKRVAVSLDDTGLALQADVERLSRKIEREIAMLERAHRPAGKRALDYGVKLRRAVGLSSVFVVGKLTAFGASRIAMTTIEELIGAPMPYLPIIGKVARQAPREGYLSLRAEKAAAVEAFSKHMAQQAKQMLFEGRHDIDLLQGKKGHDYFEPEWVEFFGRLHGMLKTPAKMAEWKRGTIKRLEYAERQGRDSTARDEMAIAAMGAYTDALRAILMQDNAFSSWFADSMRGWEQRGHPGVASAGRALFFVTKVPPNYVLESLNVIGGSIPATLKLAKWAYKTGLDDIPEPIADSIIRGYKKQGLGFLITAIGILAALGLIKSIEIGGYYERGEKRKEGEVKAGRLRIWGHDVPVWAAHSPYLEPLQVAATFVRAYRAAKLKGGDDHPLAVGAYKAGAGLVSEVPFFEEPIRAATALEGYGGAKKWIGDTARGMVLSPDIQRIARVGDQAKPTTAWEKTKQLTGFSDIVPTKRATPTIGANIQSGVPYFRNKLPVKTAFQMGASRTQVTPGIKEMDRLGLAPKNVRRFSNETAESYHARAVAEGEAALQELEDTVQQPWYKALKTKEEKKRAMQMAIRAGRQKARSDLNFMPPEKEFTQDEEP